jgi:hypothetical protein
MRCGQARRLDQAEQPSVGAADAGDQRAGDRGLLAQAFLGGLQHPHGALELELVRVVHVDFDQEVGHDAMVAPQVRTRHREEHRLGT